MKRHLCTIDADMPLEEQRFVFGMESKTTKVAKLRLESGNLRFECIAEFNLEFRSVSQHSDRLVCDRYVYRVSDFSMIQDLSIPNINYTLPLSPRVLLIAEGGGS